MDTHNQTTGFRSKPIGIHSGVKEVEITIEYLTNNCSSYSDNGGKYCKEYFDLYVHQSGQPTYPDPLTNNATYEKIAKTAPSALSIRVPQTFSVDFISISIKVNSCCSKANRRT